MMMIFLTALFALALGTSTFDAPLYDLAVIASTAAIAVATTQRPTATVAAKDWRSKLTMLKKYAAIYPVPFNIKGVTLYNRNGLLYAYSGTPRGVDDGSAEVCIGQAAAGFDTPVSMDISDLQKALKGAKPKQLVTIGLGDDIHEIVVSFDSGVSAFIERKEVPFEQNMQDPYNYGNPPTNDTCTGATFMRALRAAVGFTSSDETKAALQCVQLEVYDKGWRVLASDAHRAFVQKSSADLVTGSPTTTLLLHRSALLPVLSKKEFVDCVFLGYDEDKERILMAFTPGGKGDDYTVSVPVMDARMPSIDNVMPDPSDEDAVLISAQEWVGVLSPFQTKKYEHRLCRVTVGPESADLRVQDSIDNNRDAARATVSAVPANDKGHQPIGVNPGLAASTLSGMAFASERDEAYIYLGDPNKAIYMVPAVQPDAPIQVILMPIILGVSY